MASGWKYVQQGSDGEWNLHDNSVDTTYDVATETVTVVDTVVETEVYCVNFGANSLRKSNLIVGHVDGVITNTTPVDDITIRLYFGGDLVATFNPAIGQVAGASWHFNGNVTIRSTGIAAGYAFHGHVEIDDDDQDFNVVDTFDTTSSGEFRVTVQWDAAKATNTISLYQGYAKLGYSHEQTQSSSSSVDSSSSSSIDSSSSSSSSSPGV